jgi:hypothetical protein
VARGSQFTSVTALPRYARLTKEGIKEVDSRLRGNDCASEGSVRQMTAVTKGNRAIGSLFLLRQVVSGRKTLLSRGQLAAEEAEHTES